MWEEERVKTTEFSFCLFSLRWCRDEANACGARVEQRVNNEGKTCTNITVEGWKITIISTGVEAAARRRHGDCKLLFGARQGGQFRRESPRRIFAVANKKNKNIKTNNNKKEKGFSQ